MKIYRLINTSQERAKISITEKIDPGKIEAAKNTSAKLSGITEKTGLGSDIMAFLGIVLSADSSGATFKFSQFQKLLSRIRYIDLNYGDMLGTFLTGMGKSFDGKLTQELDSDLKTRPKAEIIKEVKKYRNK